MSLGWPVATDENKSRSSGPHLPPGTAPNSQALELSRPETVRPTRTRIWLLLKGWARSTQEMSSNMGGPHALGLQRRMGNHDQGQNWEGGFCRPRAPAARQEATRKSR